MLPENLGELLGTPLAGKDEVTHVSRLSLSFTNSFTKGKDDRQAPYNTRAKLLPLLPSGPGGVQSRPLRRTRRPGGKLATFAREGKQFLRLRARVKTQACQAASTPLNPINCGEIPHPGDVAEWLKVRDWKSRVG
jgi:hypothetical protein